MWKTRERLGEKSTILVSLRMFTMKRHYIQLSYSSVFESALQEVISIKRN